MRYSLLQWNHPHSSEPVEILSEFDEDGSERRKVERFRDGSIGYASNTESVGGTQLSLIQRPPDEEVSADPEFKILDLDMVEFERIWAAVHQPPRTLKRVS